MIRVAGVLVLVLMALAGCSAPPTSCSSRSPARRTRSFPAPANVLASNAPLDKAAAPKEAATDPIAIPPPSAMPIGRSLAGCRPTPCTISISACSSRRCSRCRLAPARRGATGCCRDRSWWAGASTSSIRKRMSAPSMPRMARIWGRPLAPKGKDPEGAFGGGLASDGNNIYAATAFGEVVALNAATGNEVWRQKLGSPEQRQRWRMARSSW